MPAQLSTAWSCGTVDDEPEILQEQHETFSTYVRGVADAELPWLFPLLDAANARVLAFPGAFSFNLDSHGNHWFEVPEVANRIRLIPWATEHDIPQ